MLYVIAQELQSSLDDSQSQVLRKTSISPDMHVFHDYIQKNNDVTQARGTFARGHLSCFELF